MMKKEEVLRLTDFHEAALAQHRFLLSPSVVHLEEQTIKALREYAKKLSDEVEGQQG